MTMTIPRDDRRKRLVFRAGHRGTREMDLVFGRYVETMIDRLDDEEVTALEKLLPVPDQVLFRWLTGEESVPAEYDRALIGRIRTFALANAEGPHNA